MSSSASPLLKVELQASGENNNAWGTLANGTFQRLEDGIAATASITLSADTTLTDTSYSANQARCMVLNLTGAGGFNVIIPNRSKVYFVRNGCSAAATITTGSGTTVSIAAGSQEWVYCNGSNVVYSVIIPASRVTGIPSETTAAQFLANTAGKALSTDKIWAAAAPVALTDAATIAVDMSTFVNASVTLGGNRTLGNPTNTKNGQSGCIQLVQDATGSRTITFSSNWKFASGVAPALTTTASATDLLFYQVLSSTLIYATLVKDVK